MRRISCRTLVALGAMTLAPWASSTAAAQRTAPIIVDHRATNLAAIPTTPTDWIAEAKASLHIAYGHTSHGSQLTEGMSGLAEWKGDRYAWNRGGLDGALDLDDGGSGGLPNDVGYYPDWYNATLSFLGAVNPSTGRGSSHPNVNVIIWSWCGQAAGLTEQTMLSTYLTPMSQLEAAYPGVTFVYMTGHLDGSGASGNLNLRNQQIRDYVAANNKVLYDFADIESYDPDGLVNYMELLANDNCDYDSDGNGSLDSNWCIDWQESHTEGVDWYNVSAAHSQALNGNRKAYAAWWLWARLAGWADEESLSMADASAAEGNEASAPPAPAAMTPVSFQASLSAASAETVTVNFTTVAGTATANVDYESLSGTITFAPGETTKQVTIQIVGDLIDEPNETFSVVLSSPVNATIEDGEGVGTIIDDDEPAVSASIADTTVTEGNSGEAPADFTVSLSSAATQEVRIDYLTTNGTATAGSDYTSTAGTLIIPQGASSGTISVDVLGDTAVEPDETFTVTLSNPDGVTLTDDSATGTIVNDDTAGDTTPVVWTSPVGVTVSTNSLTKTAAKGWNAGAVSAAQLASGDGFVQVTASETTTYRMFGLGVGNSGTNYTDVEFALYLNGGSLQVFESGTLRGTYGTYATGDTLEVALEAGGVAYKRNGTTLYTSAVTPTYPLVVDTALYSENATLSAAVVGGNWAAPPAPPMAPVTWTSAAGVTASANSLTKTAANGWNGGAISTVQLVSGDGFAQVTASERTTNRMFGLGVGNSGTSYADIEFAIYLRGGLLDVYESCTLAAALGAYATGDLLQVALEEGVVKYKKNGTTLYTSTVTPTYPLIVDTALYTLNSTLDSAIVGGSNWMTAVNWTSAVGVTVNGSSLTKTAATGWNGAAASSQELASGDGYVQVTASERTTSRMFGLGEGDSSTNYTDIEFAIYLKGGLLEVYESGTLRGSFGSFATGDRLQVAVESGVVNYKKNGTTFYTSAESPTYPLIVDSALYTLNATLSAASLGGNWTTPDPPVTVPVVWTSPVGVSVNANSLTKTAAAGWNAGAASTTQLTSGSGFVQVTASETSTYRMFGLGEGNSSTDYTDIEFALYLNGTKVQVYESGTLRGSFGSYATGDLLQVALEAGVVKYKKNGMTFYTSTATPGSPLVVDTALYSQNATLSSVVVSGNWE